MPSDSAQAAPINEIKDVPVVILCGGMGGRMGDIAKMLPKSLVPIQEYPILWYIILSLYREGFRTFVLPLGYRGQMIHEYVMSHLASLPNIRFQCIETGERTHIAKRLELIKPSLSGERILLLNGDAIFDFSVASLYQQHRATGALVSLISVELRSQWSLILESDNQPYRFLRDHVVTYVAAKNAEQYRAYLYSGIAFLELDAFNHINLSECHEFENELFSSVINTEALARLSANGFWFSVDTPKDAFVLNQLGNRDGDKIAKIKTELMRYLDISRGQS